jgi:glycosyltransferase involved in cell wall biosynthesis
MAEGAVLATVIVPTIGRLDYFADTRRSVEQQTFRDFEILVLDNASPPAAAAALREWSRSDSRLRILRVDERIPMFENFNRGIFAARGKYIAFVHDDDVYLPNYIRSSIEAMERHPSAAFCGSNYQFIDEAGRVIEHRRWIERTELVPGRRYIARMLGGARSFVPTPGLVFRRDAIRHGFDPDLSVHFGDYVWLMRIAERHDVMLLQETLIRIRRHGAQASRSLGMSRAIPLRTRTLLDYCAEYLARHPDEEAFVRGMERRIRMVHRLGLTWGWAVAPEEGEARDCAAALGHGIADRGLRTVLGALGAARARSVVARGFRRLSRHIGF